MSDLVQQARNHFAETGIIKSSTSDLVKALADEIERLRKAKSEFSKLADERAIEANNLRSQLVKAREIVAWRWRPKDSVTWIYDPEDHWREQMQGDPALEFQSLTLSLSDD